MLRLRKSEPTQLDEAIERLFVQMSNEEPYSEEYASMADQLTKLYALKEIDRPQRVTPDTLATVAANLAGIMLIVGHERAHIVTSKALSFVLKMR